MWPEWQQCSVCFRRSLREALLFALPGSLNPSSCIIAYSQCSSKLCKRPHWSIKFVRLIAVLCCAVLCCAVPRLKGKGSSSSVSSRADEVHWRKWVDERFVKVLTANIYRTWE